MERVVGWLGAGCCLQPKSKSTRSSECWSCERCSPRLPAPVACVRLDYWTVSVRPTRSKNSTQLSIELESEHIQLPMHLARCPHGQAQAHRRVCRRCCDSGVLKRQTSKLRSPNRRALLEKKRRKEDGLMHALFVLFLWPSSLSDTPSASALSLRAARPALTSHHPRRPGSLHHQVPKRWRLQGAPYPAVMGGCGRCSCFGCRKRGPLHPWQGGAGGCGPALGAERPWTQPGAAGGAVVCGAG